MYKRQVTGNPTNLSLPRTANDAYLFENLGFSNTGLASFQDTHHRVLDAYNYNPDNMRFWGVGVFKEATPGTPDFSVMPPFTTVAESARYVFGIANLYGFSAAGVGGFSFGSAGHPITSRKFALPLQFGLATSDPILNAATSTASRTYDGGSLSVVTDTSNATFTASVTYDLLGLVDEVETPSRTVVSFIKRNGFYVLIMSDGSEVIGPAIEDVPDISTLVLSVRSNGAMIDDLGSLTDLSFQPTPSGTLVTETV